MCIRDRVIAFHTQGQEIYWRFLNYIPHRSFEIGKKFSIGRKVFRNDWRTFGEEIEENYRIATQKLDCYKNYINIPEEVQIEFDWINLFGIIKKGTDLIENQFMQM